MQKTKIVCELCGQEISKSNYFKHLRRHKNHPESFKKPRYKINHDGLNCQFCGKECKNKNSLALHEVRCKNNPNKINTILNGFNSKGRKAWNEGLTKETDDRVAKQALTLKNDYDSGKIVNHNKNVPMSEEQKLKISTSRKKYLEDNPDKVPYLLNHSSKISYPELYFIDLFRNEKIDLKYHKQVGIYQLDFYNDDKLFDLEIDGELHYTSSKSIDRDLKRTEYLKSLGYTVFRIRWTEYQKLSEEEKVSLINKIKEFLI